MSPTWYLIPNFITSGPSCCSEDFPSIPMNYVGNCTFTGSGAWPCYGPVTATMSGSSMIGGATSGWTVVVTLSDGTVVGSGAWSPSNPFGCSIENETGWTAGPGDLCSTDVSSTVSVNPLDYCWDTLVCIKEDSAGLTCNQNVSRRSNLVRIQCVLPVPWRSDAERDVPGL